MRFCATPKSRFSSDSHFYNNCKLIFVVSASDCQWLTFADMNLIADHSIASIGSAVAPGEINLGEQTTVADCKTVCESDSDCVAFTYFHSDYSQTAWQEYCVGTNDLTHIVIRDTGSTSAICVTSGNIK